MPESIPMQFRSKQIKKEILSYIFMMIFSGTFIYYPSSPPPPPLPPPRHSRRLRVALVEGMRYAIESYRNDQTTTTTTDDDANDLHRRGFIKLIVEREGMPH